MEEQPEAKKKSRRAKNKKGAKDSDEEKGTPLPVPKDPVQPKRRGKKKAKRDDSEDEVDSKQELVEVAQPKSWKEKREIERERQAQKRRDGQECWLCGLKGHTRRECPGIMDGGAGQSKFRGLSSGARKAKREAAKQGSERPDTQVVQAPEVEESWFDAVCDLPRILEGTKGIRTIRNLIEDAAPGFAKLEADGCVTKLYLRPPLDGFSSVVAQDPLVRGCIVGVGPEEAALYDQEMAAQIETTLDSGVEGVAVVGLGVIGLDFTQTGLEKASPEMQLSVCLSQMQMAATRGKTCILCCRLGIDQDGPQADESLYTLLKTVMEEGYPEPPRWILHGSDGKLNRPLDVYRLMQHFPGLYLSFSGTITHSKCPRELLSALFDCPAERLIIGTGAPDFAPSGVPRNCLPSDTVLLAEKIAALKGASTTPGDVLRAARDNARRVFRLP